MPRGAEAASRMEHRQMNSEQIREKFGSYHVEVLHQDEGSRVASLYSTHDEQAICRTLAVTCFRRPLDQSLTEADRLIRQGQSIGSTLSDAGLVLDRAVLAEASVASGAAFEQLTGASVKAGATIYLRVYQLSAGKDPTILRPYAVIAEAHHPEHIPPESLLPDQASLNTDAWDTLSLAALSKLLSALN